MHNGTVIEIKPNDIWLFVFPLEVLRTKLQE